MYKFMALFCLLYLSLFKVVQLQIFSPRCPQYIPKIDFDISQFLGKWYEVEKTQLLGDPIKCIATTFSKSNSGKILVTNEGTSRLTGVQRIIKGKLNLNEKGSDKNNGKAKLNIQYNFPLNIPFSTFPFNYATSYTILETDYDNYAVAWNCNSFELIQNVWIMTRERIPSNAVLQEIYGILDKFNINRSSLSKTIQDECDDDDGSDVQIISTNLNQKKLEREN